MTEQKINNIESKFKESAEHMKLLDLDANLGGLEDLSVDELIDINQSLFEQYEELYDLEYNYKKLTGKESPLWKKYEAHFESHADLLLGECYKKSEEAGDPLAYLFSKDFRNECYKILKEKLDKEGFFNNGSKPLEEK